jgi:hypothetical protein
MEINTFPLKFSISSWISLCLCSTSKGMKNTVCKALFEGQLILGVQCSLALCHAHLTISWPLHSAWHTVGLQQIFDWLNEINTEEIFRVYICEKATKWVTQGIRIANWSSLRWVFVNTPHTALPALVFFSTCNLTVVSSGLFTWNQISEPHKIILCRQVH